MLTNVCMLTDQRGAAVGMVWLYTFAADGSWAQSGQTAKCRVRYKPNASGPSTRIRGAVKLE